MESPLLNLCSGCGTQLAASLLDCPACKRLVYAEQLKALSQQANQATDAGDLRAALEHWRQALDLLPSQSRQYQVIAEKVANLSQRVDASPGLGTAQQRDQAGSNRKWGQAAAGVGGVALLLWKFKFIVVFLLTKAKFLLLGLTKASTFFSMLLSMGAYWLAWGWAFAAGIVLSIYVHEMGHVAALRRFGMKASAPMFIPGLGALIRLKQHPIDPREDARIGLGGPIWGLAAAAVAYGVFFLTGHPILAAIARVGAWINLFNLTPIWQLDGGRGFRAMSRQQQWLAVAAIAGMWFVTAEGLLVLLLIAGIVRAFRAPKDAPGDHVATWQYIALVVLLTLMTLIKVPLPADHRSDASDGSISTVHNLL